jgi:hypothetical protein
MAVVWKEALPFDNPSNLHELCEKTHNPAMTDPDLSDLGAFVAVTRTPFAVRPRLRGVSPSSLSEAMRRLEAHVSACAS